MRVVTWLHRNSVLALFVVLAIHRGVSAPAPWEELYDPFQVRTIYLEMESGNWGSVVGDGDFDSPQNARLWMVGETPILVTVKRKSDPALGQKVSVKIDINARVPGQTWHGVKKLSLENGAEGGLVKEGFAWAMHRLAAKAGYYDYPAAQANWVRLVVDGQLIGVYTSVEERDKQMLENRGMWKENATWLYKNDPNPVLEAGSGNSPTYEHLCYLPFRTGCSAPDLETDLQSWIDMQSMLTLGAIEAFTANRDGLFTHDGKNHFFADFAPPAQLKRVYFPWDLDTGISSTTAPILGFAGEYSTQVLGHPWFRQWYLHTVNDLVNGPLSASALTEFLNQLELVLTPALLEDPNASIEGNVSGHFQSLRQWVTNRIANVRGQMSSIVAAPVFNPTAGEIVAGTTQTLTQTNLAGTIYFTLNGSDPRGPGGSIVGSAYTGPFELTNTTHVAARVHSGTNWSALRRATFNLAGHTQGLGVTELMFHPRSDGAFGKGEYEFIELRNHSDQDLNLSGCEFEGIRFRFAPGTLLEPGKIIVLVRNAVAFTNRYSGVPFNGIYWGALDDEGEKIRLKNSDGNNIFSVDYDDAPPWPLGADGFGWSLVTAQPLGDPDEPENWRASADIDGSPGAPDPVPSHPSGIVINEILAHTDAPQEDAIELFNTSSFPIDISGWWLSDQMSTADSGGVLKKFRIPANTVVGPGKFHVFYEAEFNAATLGTNVFALNSTGDDVYLSSANSEGMLSGVIRGVGFGASENGIAFGRIATSHGWDFAELRELTFGTTNPATLTQFREGNGGSNSGPRIGPVVINEIHYHPTNGGAEFIELFNRTGTTIDLSGWRLEGAGQVVPAGTSIAATNFLVVVGATNISEAAFRAAQNVPPMVPVLVWPFDLRNEGETVGLLKPNDSISNAPIVVDRLRYNDRTVWATEADGAGPSLQRVSPDSYGNDGLNWRTSLSGETAGRENARGPFVCISKGSHWKIHGGRNLGTAWRWDDYSDSGWPIGRSPFAFGQTNSVTTLTNAPEVTTYFRKEFALSDDPNSITNLMLAVCYDDGFIAYLNGEEIARRSMPIGPANFLTFADAHAGNSFENIDLTLARHRFRRGRNVLAVELHQTSSNDTIFVWDATVTYATTGVDKAPILITVSRNGSAQFVLSWNSQEGNIYRVQSSLDLINWSNLGTAVMASEPITEFRISELLVNRSQFFRIVESP